MLDLRPHWLPRSSTGVGGHLIENGRVQRWAVLATTGQETKGFKLFAGGISGDLFNSISWDEHPLGSPDQWSSVLQNLLQITFASRQPMLILWGPEFYQFYNDAFGSTLGSSDQMPLMGKRAAECGSEIWPAVEQHVHDVFSNGTSMCYEDRAIPVDRGGSLRESFWTYSLSPIFLQDGGIGGVLVISTDTTERVLQKRKEQASSDQLRLVADFSPALIAHVDRNERYQFMNRLYQKWFNFDPMAVVDRTVLDVVGPVAYEKARVPIQKALQGEHVHFENNIVLADGITKYVDLQFVPFRLQSGELNGFLILGYDLTERKKIEIALRESEARYRETHEQLTLALESAQMSTWHIDLNANQLLTLTDHRNSQPQEYKDFDLYKTIEKRIHPDDAPESARALKNTIENGTIYNDEYRLIRSDGSIRWMLSRGSAKYDQSGKAVSISGVISDITERRQTEDLYRAITELTPQFVWMGNTDGAITFSNSTLLNYMGVDQTQTLGQRWLELLHPDDRQNVTQIWETSLKTGQPYEVEFRVRAKDGTYGWFLNRAIPLRDKPSGKITSWLGVSTDITKIKKAESEQKRTADILDSIMRFSLDSIFVKDRDSKLIYCNPQTLKLIGLPESEVIGKRDVDFLGAGSGAEEIMRLDERIMSSGKGEVAEEWVKWPDGSRRLYMSQKEPRRDTQGNVVGLVGISRDITELKRVHENLQVAKEEADKANSSKSAFLANMSHEIRTPLGAIMGFVDLLKDENISRAKRDQYLAIIDRNSSQLLRIIDDILDLSKVEAGMIQVEQMDFSLPEMLHYFSSIMSFRAREKGIIFEIVARTPFPNIVNSDPTRLRQILTNVVGNAIKFTASGRVTMQVSYKNGIIEFEVHDTGKGISSEQMQGLFQPFSQADASITRKFGGTGLGLVLTRRLTEALGGEFFLKESRIDQGSTFVAIVKVGVPKHAQMVKTLGYEPVAPKAPAAFGPLHNFKILLVEDSPDNQALISIFLEKSGASVEVANNGAEGVKAALEGKFDAVLMDVQMPVMDGLSAVKALRQKGYQKPILALTAHAMKEEKQRCISAGFSDFLTKPIQRNVLIAMLAQLKTEN